MELGIITFISNDKTHGYILRLDDLNEKCVYDVIKRNDRDQSYYIKLYDENTSLRKFQIVSFTEKTDNQGRRQAKICNTYFKAISYSAGNRFRFFIVEFDNSIYSAETKNEEFGNSNSGVLMFQIYATIGRFSADLNFINIITDFNNNTNTKYWFNKFLKISSQYSEQLAPTFDIILHSIIRYLKQHKEEHFDFKKLFSKAILIINENCENDDYSSLTSFIRFWKNNFDTLFTFNELSLEIKQNIQFKVEFWVLDLYSFEELFEDKNQITYEAIEYASNKDKEWRYDFLLKLKAVGVSVEDIQKVLFKSIPKELPDDFEDLDTDIIFIDTYFPELKQNYLKELIQNKTKIDQILLWENNIIEIPQIEVLKDVINEVSGKTKIKIFNTVNVLDKVSLLNASLQSSLGVPEYYENIFNDIKGIINDSNSYVFDLEFDGHNINELAFSHNGKIINAISTIEVNNLLSEFIKVICNSNSFLAGHNIEKFDLPILRQKIELPKDINVVDTLLIETLLSPSLKSFALATNHNAKDDVEHTLNLLTNQLIRLIHISDNQLNRFEKFINAGFMDFLFKLRKNILHNSPELTTYFETERNKYFINKEIGSEKSKELENFLKNKSTEPIFIIAPKEFYPLLAGLPNIQFSDDGSDYSRIISKEKVQYLPDGSLEKYLLESYIEKCEVESKVPIYLNLPGRIKILISENVSIDFITEETALLAKTENRICISPDKMVEIIPQIKKLRSSVILIESDLISVTEKTLLKTLDYTALQQRLNNDSFWMYFTGGQSRVEITKEDLKKLQVENVAEHFEFFWIEKTTLDTFQVWGNFDFKNLLISKLAKNKVSEFCFDREEMEKENCKYVIPKSISGKLSITRYNPETRYRDRYWTFQLKLIQDIVSKNSKPTVLIINLQKEKQKLFDYFTSLKYYVPDFSSSTIRQVDLLVNHPSRRKILIITREQIPEIILSENLNGFNFIIDSFELEEKWFISKGTGFLEQAEKIESGLKLKANDFHRQAKKEDDDENENSNPVFSSQDIFVLLKIQKPIIDYYRWLFNSADKNSTVWLTDSRLGDFAGLEEEWAAKKVFAEIWKNEEEYKNDYEYLKKYFRSTVPNEEINLNTIDEIKSAKIALAQLFLNDEKEGKTNSWYDYQNDYLDKILPAKENVLITLPTGGGKSLLFQAPSLYRGSITGRLTIVVTPLKALMEDQVETLKSKYKFYGSVDFINQDRKDIRYIYRRIVGGEILLLYITPERYRSNAFRKVLDMRIENDGGLEYVVYDEAHCVSQWGLDFRPDYLNSAYVNKGLKIKCDHKFPLLLFSATVSKQISNDFEDKFGNAIDTINREEIAYNPVREHIALTFESSDDKEMKLFQIAEALFRGNFNANKSRCLVFVRRRKDAEENVQLLEIKLNEIFGGDAFTGTVAYFHAGMNYEERQEVYNAYKSGDKSILLATKAFGMGMDIPNIHYVYHFGPSGTLEDYLQEVGRAGRNERQLHDAGFSKDNPIQTKCFFENDDFGNIKTLLQNGRITWSNLISVYSAIKVYYSKFRNFEIQNDKPIVLPFNILSQTSEFDNIHDKDQMLRLCLYWLEKLERIKLGFYAPGQLQFSGYKKPADSKIESVKQQNLITVIERAWNEKDEGIEAVSLELNNLLTATDLANTSDLLTLIFKCQKKKIFRYENELKIYPTKKKMDELNYFNHSWKEPNYPTLDAVIDLAYNLMDIVPIRDQYSFESEYIETQKGIVAGAFFNPDSLPWMVEKDSHGELTQKSINRISKEQKDFERNKVKFAFTLADFIPKVRHQTLITHKVGQKSKIVQVIYNGCRVKEDWKKFFHEFKKDLISLLKHVSRTFISQGTKRYNVAELTLLLGLEEKETEYIENLLAFANWLGYLHYEGTFLPMGVELYMQSQKEIRQEEKNSVDKYIYEEFQATQKLRELRLLALQCLSKLETKDVKDAFISKYFSCKDSEEIIALLELYFGADSDKLREFRQEALLKAVYGEETENGERKGGLSDEQLKVYEADKHSNVQVIAGPGSGKTHTLTLRVARLIHQENISPENILVLAYNRAVVVELKERLTKLFSSLGYANIIQRLKVFTFHGLCKFTLRDSIQDLEFSKWIPKFIETARGQPGIISNQLGVIQYVFVDEFQDITDERLELLKHIANPANTFTTVIGDPNQSIYGYERVNENGSRSPRANYDKFASIYKPIVLRIGDNFRSYPQILTAAERLISYNQDTFDFVPLRPTTNATHTYREIISCDGINDSWLDKLGELVEEVNPVTGNKYRQVALMFRRNIEIYRAYNLIEKKKQELNWNIRMRIQGEGEDFTRTREIAWVLDNFYKSKSEQRITKDFIEQYKTYQTTLSIRFPNWDLYYLIFFECLLHEFSKNKEDDSTYKDLLEFVQELAQKDDGQLSKIYYNHLRAVIGEDHTTEIVLTTMHKVKGLEFDAVIIPASFTNLPLRDSELENLDDENFRELVEEERRLMYVAYTRAKYRLVAYFGEREKAMRDGTNHSFPEEEINALGISVPSGMDKFFIGWGATNSGNAVFNTIEQTLKFGSTISLRLANHNWFLNFNGIRIACLSNKISNYLSTKTNGYTTIEGFRVSNIYKWTKEDTQKFDLKNSTNFETSWTETARQRGYIYLIEFSGYGTAQ